MIKLSAFADEVSENFEEQLKFLVNENIKYIELRFLNKKNILDLDEKKVKTAKKLLSDCGIKVSAIGSPIGKIRINEPFEPHLDRFKHTIELAYLFDTNLIRVFSYYPPEGESINNYRGQVIERMIAKAELLNGTGIIMVHENEADIYGCSAENCVDLVKAVGSQFLRLAYDPANFVWACGILDNFNSCWPIMKPFVEHIHIKDWKVNADTGSMPGEGDGQIKELLTDLKEMNYKGFVTMEPHLKIGGQFGGVTGADLFAEAINVIKKIAIELNLKFC